jgi:hypothetical protein
VVNPGDIAKAQGIQHPFQTSIDCSFGTSAPDPNNCFGHVSLPAKQRLVIEYVSAFCRLKPNVALVIVNIAADVGGSFFPVNHQLPIVNPVGAITPTGSSAVNLGSPVRIYADEGSTVFVSAGATADNSGFSCTMNLSGQTVDVP